MRIFCKLTLLLYIFYPDNCFGMGVLPEDVCQYIITFVTPDSLYTLSVVNKQFRQLTCHRREEYKSEQLTLLKKRFDRCHYPTDIKHRSIYWNSAYGVGLLWEIQWEYAYTLCEGYNCKPTTFGKNHQVNKVQAIKNGIYSQKTWKSYGELKSMPCDFLMCDKARWLSLSYSEYDVHTIEYFPKTHQFCEYEVKVCAENKDTHYSSALFKYPPFLFKLIDNIREQKESTIADYSLHSHINLKVSCELLLNNTQNNTETGDTQTGDLLSQLFAAHSSGYKIQGSFGPPLDIWLTQFYHQQWPFYKRINPLLYSVNAYKKRIKNSLFKEHSPNFVYIDNIEQFKKQLIRTGYVFSAEYILMVVYRWYAYSRSLISGIYQQCMFIAKQPHDTN